MPTEGALIRASDYTEVRKQISRILGDKILEFQSEPLRATYGYGQEVLSDSQNVVREVSLVDDVHINTLKVDVLKIASHCGIQFNPIITSLPTIATGDIIDNAHLEAYSAAINLLNANRFELDPAQSSIEDILNDQGNPITNSRSAPWGNNNTYSDATVRHDFTIDFGSANAARYFFNSGGEIRFSASRVGGVNSYQDQVWTNLLTQMGTIIFKYNSCFGEAGTNSNIGFYQLTNIPQLVFTKGGSATYVYATEYLANDYSIYISCNVNNNQFGEARYVYVSIQFNDDHINSPGNVPATQDQVTGVLTSTVKLRRATGSNVSVTAPIAANTVLLTS